MLSEMFLKFHCASGILFMHNIMSSTQEYVSANPRRLIWLSVDEKGVSIRERVSLKIFKSYSYNEISTFGGNGEDYFMLVISSPSSASAGQSLNAGSRSQLPSQQGNTVEKLMFAMPKLKVDSIS